MNPGQLVQATLPAVPSLQSWCMLLKSPQSWYQNIHLPSILGSILFPKGTYPISYIFPETFLWGEGRGGGEGYGLGTTSGGAQGLFFTLFSGITPDRAWGTIWGVRDWTCYILSHHLPNLPPSLAPNYFYPLISRCVFKLLFINSIILFTFSLHLDAMWQVLF